MYSQTKLRSMCEHNLCTLVQELSGKAEAHAHIILPRPLHTIFPCLSYTHTSMVAVTLIGLLVTLITRSMGLKWPYVHTHSLPQKCTLSSYCMLTHRSMVFSIVHCFVLEVVNVYCMIPLIWSVTSAHHSVFRCLLCVTHSLLTGVLSLTCHCSCCFICSLRCLVSVRSPSLSLCTVWLCIVLKSCTLLPLCASGIWWWLQDEQFRKQDPRFIIVRYCLADSCLT